MILSRAFSMFLRGAQFVCAAVVLGLSAYLLDNRQSNDGPFKRLIYVVVLSAISIIASAIWFIPTLSSMSASFLDFPLVAAWFAAFGVLVHYLRGGSCGRTFDWSGVSFTDNVCGQWKATQAFSFLAAIFWTASFLLGLYITFKGRRSQETTYRSRRRWHGSRV